MGYNFSNARNMEEKLLITLVHEAQHANHMARYQEAMRNNATPHLAAINLMERGYSLDFVQIFFTMGENRVYIQNSDSDRIGNMHDYMETWNRPLIDAALAEYRRDYGN